jgi:hypothetical protein
VEALEIKQGYYFDSSLKAGLLGLETPLVEMIALLLESKLCSIWTGSLWKLRLELKLVL